MGNARFFYGDNSFDVYVTKFSYSWALKQKGASQARQKQVIYAWRAEQSSLSVELQFPSLAEYRSFANFARGYHMAITSVSGKVGGPDIPAMYFVSDSIPHQTTNENGMAYVGGIKYAVALPSIPIVYTNDSVAPTMRLTLEILMDESGNLALESISSSTVQNSIRSSLALRKVRADAVKAAGSAAYLAAGMVANAVDRMLG